MNINLLLSLTLLTLSLSSFAHSENVSKGVDEILLERYLNEIEKRSELKIRNEKSRLKIVKMVYKEKFKRWWEQYNSEQYWAKYYQGVKDGKNLYSSFSGYESCNKYKQAVGHISNDSPGDDAYIKGMISANVHCYIDDNTDVLKVTANNILTLEEKLTNIKLNFLHQLPTEDELITISDKISDDIKVMVISKMSGMKVQLEDAIIVNLDLLAQVKNRARELSRTISCPTLITRTHKQFICKPIITNSNTVLKDSDVLNILLKQRMVGTVQTKLNIRSLLEATNYYLQMNRGTSAMAVNYYVNRLKETIEELQSKQAEKLSATLFNWNEYVKRGMREIKLIHIDIFKDIFTDELRKDITEQLVAYKYVLTRYKRVTASTTTENELVNNTINDFNNVVSSTATFNVILDVESSPIYIIFDNIQFSIPYKFTGELSSHLMGRTNIEVTNLINELIIKQ